MDRKSLVTMSALLLNYITANLSAQSGARDWTRSERKAFANDMVRPQLWTVTTKINSAKSDKSPDTWKPPLDSVWCAYSASWIAVKSYWNLTVTAVEKEHLALMLTRC
jgi:hypothetical protein